jgi:hypothetical protein
VSVYIVTRKSDGVEVSRYAAGGVSLLDQYPLANFYHAEWFPDDPAPGPMKITQLAFRSRFTQAEKITIELASIDVPDGQMASRQASAQMRVWLADIEAAQFIDLNYQATRDGVRALEDYGLIAVGRATQILDTPPTADEVFYG